MPAGVLSMAETNFFSPLSTLTCECQRMLTRIYHWP